jgi:hypothetical protein
MKSKYFQVAAAAMLGFTLAGASSALAVTLRTPPVLADPQGYVYCTVVATSRKPIGITAEIVSAAGTNVTAFGTGFRASPAATTDGLFHAEETAGSFADDARYCQVTVSSAHKKDICVTLTAFDSNGRPLTSVELP